jgi:hypothetical protein
VAWVTLSLKYALLIDVICIAAMARTPMARIIKPAATSIRVKPVRLLIALFNSYPSRRRGNSDSPLHPSRIL